MPFCLSFLSEAEESAVAFLRKSVTLPTMPPREYHFYVYIMASRSHDLYVGFTINIFRRVAEHRIAPPGSYTARYNINRLVYYEHFTYVLNAIAREKELKDWNREKKLTLIEAANPTWQDLARDW
jgi:putative endonuclease